MTAERNTWTPKRAKWPGECGICRGLYAPDAEIVTHPEHRSRHARCHQKTLVDVTPVSATKRGDL